MLRPNYYSLEEAHNTGCGSHAGQGAVDAYYSSVCYSILMKHDPHPSTADARRKEREIHLCAVSPSAAALSGRRASRPSPSLAGARRDRDTHPPSFPSPQSLRDPQHIPCEAPRMAGDPRFQTQYERVDSDSSQLPFIPYVRSSHPHRPLSTPFPRAVGVQGIYHRTR